MGCFGGIINYILVDDRKKIEKLEILKSIFLGVGASFLVPLFLNTISSNLIIEAKDDFSKLVVFTGFCLIASIFSRNFIFALSKKFIKDIQQRQSIVEEKISNIHDIVEPIIEREMEPHVSEETKDDNTNDKYNQNEINFLLSLYKSFYALRPLSAISKEINLSNEEVQLIANKFVSDGILLTVKNDRNLLHYG